MNARLEEWIKKFPPAEVDPEFYEVLKEEMAAAAAEYAESRPGGRRPHHSRRPDRTMYLSVEDLWKLSNACRPIQDAFGGHMVYIVGSVLHRDDFRDVDLRVILPDEEYERLFLPVRNGVGRHDHRYARPVPNVDSNRGQRYAPLGHRSAGGFPGPVSYRSQTIRRQAQPRDPAAVHQPRVQASVDE